MIINETYGKITNKARINYQKKFKIEFEKSKCNDKWKNIYEYSDGKCGEVYYIENNSDKITLKEAIDK
ncbi:MAG: hypothetical protein K2I70_00370, partial [Bacilli bacterium]|nr:hypothetical protein [Bacilli bacterium]